MKVISLSKSEKLEGKNYTIHRMVNPVTVGSEKLMSFFVTIDVGGEIPEHGHGPAEAMLHFLQGQALVVVDGEERVVHPGLEVHVPVGSSIGLKNSAQRKLKFIVVLSPPIDVSVCPVCGIEITQSVAREVAS